MPPQNDFNNQSFDYNNPQSFNQFGGADSVVPNKPVSVAPEPELPASPDKDHQLELLSSKMDVLKAMVENLGQKISSLESRLELESERRKKSW